MTRCVTDNPSALGRRLDETLAALVPAVADLLRQLGQGQEPSLGREGSARVLSVPVRFPDGVGHGAVVARVFRYRTAVRVDVEIVHDRMLASSDGTPTTRRCFLNDFVASVMLVPDTTALPEAFVRNVLTGVRAAVSAVETHNRHHKEPWSQVNVVGSARTDTD
jgi:hypothetical protein